MDTETSKMMPGSPVEALYEATWKMSLIAIKGRPPRAYAQMTGEDGVTAADLLQNAQRTAVPATPAPLGRLERHDFR
jgi:hypothetical protein